MNPEKCPSASLPSSATGPNLASEPSSAAVHASFPNGSVRRLAGGGDARAVDADLALRAITLLQSLLEKVIGERAAEEKRRTPGPRRTYTPRSEVPLRQLGVPHVMPTQVRRRSLHFSCPSCGRETVVIRRQAGARLRCPQCQAAMTAPFPGRGRSAHNCERDIESVLRPESFAAPVRPLPPRWVRLVMKEPVLILAMAAMVPFSALLLLEITTVIDKSREGVPASIVTVEPRMPTRGPADGAAERAVALVERYLAAPTAHAKSEFVRDPQRVRLLMLSLAARDPDSFAATAPEVVKAAGLSHYDDPSNPVPVTPVVAHLTDGTSRTFFVEHAPDGDAIEWESSIGYSEPLDLELAHQKNATTKSSRAVWRVEATPDHYFNRAFANEEGLVCLKLARPGSPDDTFWAYAPKNSEVADALQRIWTEAPHDFVQRLTVTVEAGPATAKTRQIHLAAVHHAGWRTPGPQAPLIAGNLRR